MTVIEMMYGEGNTQFLTAPSAYNIPVPQNNRDNREQNNFLVSYDRQQPPCKIPPYWIHTISTT